MRSRSNSRISDSFARTIEAELGPQHASWGPRPCPRPARTESMPRMLGDSPEIAIVSRRIERIARADAGVLIQGETGSGKELAARSIHVASARREGPFVAVNCGAVPDSLVETELFGHARGAFTDAKEGRIGVIAQAQGGTLFLDETDTLSPKAQVTLLRFLQDLRYRPVGSVNEVRSDVRVIAASNQDLHLLVDDGRFRRDLLYRLNIFELWIPPLRARPDDIELLAHHFIDVFCEKYGIGERRLHPSAVRWLRGHDWPGNIRELENWIHRELLLADDDEIRVSDGAEPRACRTVVDEAVLDLRSAKARVLADFEASYLTRTLATAGGNVTVAARLAGTERRAFGKLLKKYNIDKSQYHS